MTPLPIDLNDTKFPRSPSLSQLTSVASKLLRFETTDPLLAEVNNNYKGHSEFPDRIIARVSIKVRFQSDEIGRQISTMDRATVGIELTVNVEL